MAHGTEVGGLPVARSEVGVFLAELGAEVGCLSAARGAGAGPRRREVEDLHVGCFSAEEEEDM
jgi:hypothetical protein